MNKVIIAYNLGEDERKNELFKKNMATAFSRLKMDGFKTDSENVFVISKKEQIESIDLSDVSILVSAEEVDGVRIGMGSLKRWANSNPNLKIILIVSSDKKASGKLNALYNAEFYSVLYNNDFSWTNIKDILVNGRTKESAYEYFGIADFTEPVKPEKSPKKSEEVAVQKESVSLSSPAKAKDGKGTAKDRQNDRKEENPSAQKGDKNVPIAKKDVNKSVEEDTKAEQNISKDSKKQNFADKKNVQDKKSEGNTETKAPLADKKTVKEANKNKKETKKKEPVKEINKSDETSSSKGKNALDNKKNQKNNTEKVRENSKDKASNNNEKADKDGGKAKNKEKPTVKSQPNADAIEPGEDGKTVKISERKDENGPAVVIPKDYATGEDPTVSSESYTEETEGDDYDELDTSEFLVRAMEEEELDDIDWLNANDDDIDDFISRMDEKAFNPVQITKELTDEEVVLEDILRYYTKEDPIYIANLESGLISKAQFEQELMQKIAAHKNLSAEQVQYVFDSFSMFMWNYDIITPFIEDPAISDIALVAWDNIQIKRYGVRYFSRIIFRSEAHYRAFINHIVKHNHVDLSDKMPNKTFMDTTTSESARMRFVYSQEYINATGVPTLVIRKVPTTKYTIKDLVDKKMMTKQTAAFLLDKVRRGASIVFTGTMASGKSTCINTYHDYIRGDKRGLVVQESDELFSSTQKLFTYQNIRISEDGKKIFDLRYLTRYALLMDVDYLINGEIKGAESEQYVEAVFANIVTMTSVHSPGAFKALPRLADLATTDQFSRKQQLRKLAEGVDYVVYLDKFVVMEIAEVVGWDEKAEDVIYNNVPITIPKKKINTTKYKRMLKK